MNRSQPLSNTIISRSDLERIKKSVQPETQDSFKDRRAELKKKSEDRLQHWPNTLEALRKKKESFLKDKEDAIEAERRKIDEEEAEVKKQQRLEAIKRANQLLYEQTDRMKVLRSEELYAKVIDERKVQLAEKQRLKEIEKQKEREFHEGLMAQLKKQEMDEQSKLEQEWRNQQNVLEHLNEQVISRKTKKEVEAINHKRMQEAMLIEAQRELEAEKNAEERYRLRCKKGSDDMLLANDELLVIRSEISAKQALEEEKRLREVELIEKRKIARKALEQRKFEKAQETRQKMIEAAVKALTEKNSHDETRLEQQVQHMQDKVDRINKEKEEKREKEWSNIVQSRAELLEFKASKALKEKQYNERIADIMKEQAKMEEAKEKEKEKEANQIVANIKANQIADAVAAQRKKVEERMAQLQIDNAVKERMKQEDETFLNIAKQEIEKYAKEGKSTYTLQKAMVRQPTELIAAPLNKSAARPKPVAP